MKNVYPLSNKETGENFARQNCASPPTRGASAVVTRVLCGDGVHCSWLFNSYRYLKGLSHEIFNLWVFCNETLYVVKDLKKKFVGYVRLHYKLLRKLNILIFCQCSIQQKLAMHFEQCGGSVSF